ncbi:MAG: hypothetical protein H6Q75_1636 [Firmicutes bacterium]|nr:hypothetical protein [Bacillota bacterium]
MDQKQKQLKDLLSSMSFDSIQDVMENAGDDTIWRPFYNDGAEIDRFISFIDAVEKSKSWPAIRNKEKGNLLEDLMKFVFSRFVNVISVSRALTTDNEIDLDVKFNEILSPQVVQDLKCYFICECKNMVSSSISVGMVTKLVELCKSNMAGIGIFVSLKGIGGKGWRYGEGKRKKLFLKTSIPIVSFTLDEIKTLVEPNANFYSLIKKKYRLLVDELDYDGQAIGEYAKDDPDFVQVLKDTVKSLQEVELLTKSECAEILQRISIKYE